MASARSVRVRAPVYVLVPAGGEPVTSVLAKVWKASVMENGVREGRSPKNRQEIEPLTCSSAEPYGPPRLSESIECLGN
jgi:hypothetical protein